MLPAMMVRVAEVKMTTRKSLFELIIFDISGNPKDLIR